MSNFKKLVEARMAETGEGWQAAATHVRAQVLEEASEKAKTYVERLNSGIVKSMPYGKFLGPRTIEAWQTIELVSEITASECPWSPSHIQFVETLRDQGLQIVSMSVGRRDQTISTNPVPLEAFIGDANVYLGLDMITVEAPLKIGIRNTGDKSHLVIGYLSGIAHIVPIVEDPLASWRATDVDRVMLRLENLVLPPHTTKTAHLIVSDEAREKDIIRQIRPGKALVPRGGVLTFLADDVEYKITQFMMQALDDVLVDVRVDGESVTGGFVESARFSYHGGGAMIEFNHGLRPIEFTKPFTKNKTKFEVILKNDGDHPRDVTGTVVLARRLTLSEIEAVQAFRKSSPHVFKQDERFPWNFEGKKEKAPVAPGETKTFEAPLQCIFRGEALVVDPECRDDFEILDIKVGREPCEIFDKPIPAARFHEDNGLRLKLETVSPGMVVRLIVKNVSKESHDFGATLKGDALL